MNDEQPDGRRSTDKTSDEIRGLIKTTGPESEKELLLILLKLNDQADVSGATLKTLSNTVEKIAERFDAHETNHKVVIGKVQVAWMIISAIVFAVNGVVVWAVKGHLSDDKEFHVEFTQVRKDVDLLQERRRIEDAMSKEKK